MKPVSRTGNADYKQPVRQLLSVSKGRKWMDHLPQPCAMASLPSVPMKAKRRRTAARRETDCRRQTTDSAGLGEARAWPFLVMAVGTDRTRRLWKRLGPVSSETLSRPVMAVKTLASRNS
jgi:hypothetical protein